MNSFTRTPKWLFQTGVYYTLSRSALCVLGCLSDALEARDDCGSIRTSVIVEKTGLSKQSVCSAMAELIEVGVVVREKGQARFTFPLTQGVKHALPKSSTLDPNGQARLTEGSSTVDLEVKHALPTDGRNKDSPRTLTKNTLQEAESVGDGLIPYNGKRVNPAEVHKALLDRIGWPENRRGNAKNLIAHALLAVADGAEGPEAASNPVPWLAVQLKPAVDGAEDPRFVPKIGNWFNENYPHLVANAQPFGARRIYA